MIMDGFSLHEVLLFSCDLKIDYVTWDCIGHENHQLILFCNGFTFGSNIKYLYLFVNRIFFSFPFQQVYACCLTKIWNRDELNVIFAGSNVPVRTIVPV